MRTLVTGGGGQLARALLRTNRLDHKISVHGIETLDVTSSDQVEEAIRAFEPEIIINTAAYTAVDQAESDEENAAVVNEDGPRILARSAMRHGSRLFHISTDFVFDGDSNRPWSTTDQTNPVSVYGRTKRDGERAIMESGLEDWTIVRTAWLYDGSGPNFFTSMCRLMTERDEIGVVADQTGTPTLSDSLATAIWCLAEEGVTGTHHWTDSGSTTWHGFATAIEEFGYKSGLLDSRTRVKPIITEDYPTPAIRPRYSVLDKTKTWEALEGTRAMPPVDWRENLERMIREKSSV